MELTDPVTVVKGVGEELAKKLAILGVKTVADLIDYLPRRYEDYSDVMAIRDLHPGPVTIKAVVKQAVGRYVRRGMHLTEAVVSDDTGSLKLIWFNQPYLSDQIDRGDPAMCLSNRNLFGREAAHPLDHGRGSAFDGMHVD